MNTVRNDGTVNLPQGDTINDSIIIDGQRLNPSWDDVYEYPPRYYYDEETDTLCLDGYWGGICITDAPDIIIDGRNEAFMFSPEVKHLYLGAHFNTDDIHHVYPICLCPVYVSPMNRVFAEVNNIPVYKKDNKPVLRSCGKGLYEICRDTKWGVIDENFKQVIPCKYDRIGKFSRNGLIGVSIRLEDGRFLYGLADRQGVERVPVVYESIRRTAKGIWILGKDGDEYAFDRFGKLINAAQNEIHIELLNSYSIN